jgi:hypothetical protein
LAIINNQIIAASSGSLKLNSESGTLLQRIAERDARKAEERRRIAELKEQEEMLDCTFHPTTHQLPDFIKSIAAVHGYDNHSSFNRS